MIFKKIESNRNFTGFDKYHDNYEEFSLSQIIFVTNEKQTKELKQYKSWIIYYIYVYQDIFYISFEEAPKLFIDFNKYHDNCEDSSDNFPYYKLFIFILMKTN